MAQVVLDWNKYQKAAIDTASEGIVMLENRGGALPLKRGSRAALFGRMQTHYYKSGTGSGGMVNVSHVVDIREALDKAPGLTLDGELMDVYDRWDADNPLDPGLGWGKEAWSQPEMPVEPAFAQKLAARNDAAIVIIARTAGEDRDNSSDKGAFYLSDLEEELLKVVSEAFECTIVLLNVGNIIDMSFADRYDISSVLYVWQSGMLGGCAVARILTGEESPSGCLPDTIAVSLDSYPSNDNFGTKDPFEDVYQEDIFVGYRYFSTFAPEAVRYPFGSGLSYTTFALNDINFKYSDGTVSVKVTVKNTGSCSGRKAVMLYAQAPAGKLSKPARVLIGFAKTGNIPSGATEELTITAEKRTFASFDDDGRTGLGTGFILDAGTYNFYLGSDFMSAARIGSFELSGPELLEKLDCALAPRKAFRRLVAADDGNGGMSKAYEDTPLETARYLDTRMTRVPAEIPQTGDCGIKLTDVKHGRRTMDEFVAQLTDEDLSLIIRGEGMGSPKVTIGTAAAFGGVTKELKAMGIPTLCCSDGPSGMRIDSGKKAFSLPNGTCLASTFNTELVEELYTYLGIEMLTNRIDTILGPGINIHRHPLNGRNFEYFSEDPLLTGKMAVAQIRALERNGVTPTVKHLCANNRETNRREMNSVVSSRALREVYLPAFEMCVKEGRCRSIMSSYNIINDRYSANNYDQNTMILREQWGYTGLEMSDWWAYIGKNGDCDTEYSMEGHAAMARSQNDVYMVCTTVEKEELNETDCYRELTEGDGSMITRAELQRNAANILRFAMHTPAMDRLEGNNVEIEQIDSPFKQDDVNVDAGVFYTMGDDPIVIECTENTAAGKDFVFGLTVNRKGIFSLEFTASSLLPGTAQIPMMIFLTSIPISVLTWNGTDGKDATMKTDSFMYSKNCVYRIHFSGAGVELKNIRVSFKRDFEEGDSL